MQERIQPDITGTGHAYGPVVQLVPEREGPAAVRLTYPSLPIDGRGRGRLTSLVFRNALEFRFRDHELGLTGLDEFGGFCLTEIKRSKLLGLFGKQGRVKAKESGQIKERDLRHFTLTFDEHGTYTVVCTGLEITTADSDDAGRHLDRHAL